MVSADKYDFISRQFGYQPSALLDRYPTYLLWLAKRELIDRERRATERRFKEAAFLVLKTIETFDFAAQVSINEPLVRELLRGEYIGKREILLLVGNPGTDKTHLPFEQWTEVMGSERLTGALLDRLTRRVHILEANGESYRLSDAKRRLKWK